MAAPGPLGAALLAALLAVATALLLSQYNLQPSALLQPNSQPQRRSAARDTAVEASASRSLAHLPALDRAALEAFAAASAARGLAWGTYRSGLYFGVRSRSFPRSVSAGLLWGSTLEDVTQLRYEARQDDRLQTYGWRRHDGRSFADQRIEDQHNRVALRTLYARLDKQQGGVDGWAARVLASHVEPVDKRLRKQGEEASQLSLYFFVELGCGDESLKNPCREALKDLLEVAVEPSNASELCADVADGSEMCSQLVISSSSPDDDDDDDDDDNEKDPQVDSTGIDAPLDFQLHVQLRTKAGSVAAAELRYAGLPETSVLNIKESLVARAKPVVDSEGNPTTEKKIILGNSIGEGSTIIVVQAIVDVLDMRALRENDVTLEVVLKDTSGNTEKASASDMHAFVTKTLHQHEDAFERKFEDTFQLASKGFHHSDTTSEISADPKFNESHIRFAQAALGELVGGLSYFYGSSLIEHDPRKPKDIIESPPKPLFTASPSRSFFPRGFLWDEGFHQLGISSFDYRLSMDVIAHWLNLMEDDGYITREQILGEVARRRVFPSEFLIQHVEHANPPTLLLAVEKIIKQGMKEDGDHSEIYEFLRVAFPFLERWYDWFAFTQRGSRQDGEAASMRWRGRHPDDSRLVANTLSSGLDDYPRASHPSPKEIHVDLLAWMAKSSEIMSRIAEVVGETEKVESYRRQQERYTNGLDKYHWDEQRQSYFDVGEHSTDGIIENLVVVRCGDPSGDSVMWKAPMADVQRRRVRCPKSHPRFMFPLGDGNGGLMVKPTFIPRTVRFFFRDCLVVFRDLTRFVMCWLLDESAIRRTYRIRQCFPAASEAFTSGFPKAVGPASWADSES